MRSPRVVLIVVTLAALISVSGEASADERSAPQLMIDRVSSATLPDRDPLDLATRLRGASTSGSPAATPGPMARGDAETFWVLDQRTAQLFQTRAVLRLVTDHAYWFVQSDMVDRAPQADLEQSASVFETRTYPLIRRYFSAEDRPTLGRDARVVFLLANVPSVAAYFSSADAYPRTVNPRSNEQDMIYVNLNSLRPGQSGFDSTITHELQHMANFSRCPSQEGWLDEGASELAMRVAGYEGGAPAAFAAHPDVQLTAWTDQPGDLTRHYQASYLFLRYVAERGGGWEALPDILAACARGENLFAAYLAHNPIGADVDTLFSDWTVANLLQDGSVADGRYTYAGSNFHVAPTGRASAQTPFLGSVPQYAANYVELPSIKGEAVFSGEPSVDLVPVSVDSAGIWWSNRGDNLDSKITRHLDLSGTLHPTVRFRAWYDLEKQFDFVYLSASRDDGHSWQVLHAQHTTPDRSAGNNYGEGWTGSTGADWVDEQVDLTSFAGSSILLRFEYVTDQSYNGPGFAFKDLRIGDIGLDEPGAVEDAWNAEGWLRVDAPIPERWNVRLVRWTRSETTVEPVAVDTDGMATVPLDPTALRSVLVIAPTAPRTLVRGDYSIALTPSP